VPGEYGHTPPDVTRLCSPNDVATPDGALRHPAVPFSSVIRDASVDDVAGLLALEEICFHSDRLSERSFRRFLTRPTAALLVDEEGVTLAGYVLVLFHRSTSLARLYSIAVSPAHRGKGLGRALLQAAEARAMDREATRMRLEVHVGNEPAQRLYHEAGYRDFAVVSGYYDDGDALRMEKELAPHLAPSLDRVPFYRQSLDFTCGAASLLMAMAAQDRTVGSSPAAVAPIPFDRAEELRLWREATTVFMTSGHGGCGPMGLALAAWKRGFDVELAATDVTEMFVDSVRSEEKKVVIRLVADGFREELAQTGVRVAPAPLTIAGLRQRLDAGGIPVLLISTWRLAGWRAPHWVVLTAADDRFLYLNDPYVDTGEGRTETDCIGIPVLPKELERMMVLGRRRNSAVVTLFGRR
jgi:ribosomal protein S18 acetylase RimI-like enzyme